MELISLLTTLEEQGIDPEKHLLNLFDQLTKLDIQVTSDDEVTEAEDGFDEKLLIAEITDTEDHTYFIDPELDPTERMFGELYTNKLLTRDREQHIMARIDRWYRASAKLNKPDISAQERHKQRAIASRAFPAFTVLLSANVRLVFSIAKRYQNLGLPLPDLMQEGKIGLLKAAKRFDRARQLRFSTYATWWIRQSITRALDNQGRTIRLPAYMVDRLAKFHRALAEFVQITGIVPRLRNEADLRQLAKLMGNITPRELANVVLLTNIRPREFRLMQTMMEGMRMRK